MKCKISYPQRTRLQLAKVTKLYGPNFEVSDTPNGFLVHNLGDHEFPYGVDLLVPHEFIHTDTGDWLNPLSWYTDFHGTIADNSGVHFRGHCVEAIFGRYAPQPRLLTVTGPKDASHVLIRVRWDLDIDVRQIGISEPEHALFASSWMHWDQSRGLRFYVFDLSDLDPKSVIRHIFAFQTDMVLQNLEERLQRLYKEKDLIRKELEALAKTLPKGWDLEFSVSEPFELTLTRTDVLGTSTHRLYLCWGTVQYLTTLLDYYDRRHLAQNLDARDWPPSGHA